MTAPAPPPAALRRARGAQLHRHRRACAAACARSPAGPSAAALPTLSGLRRVRRALRGLTRGRWVFLEPAD